MNQFKNKYFLIIVICMNVAFLSKGVSRTLEHRLHVNYPLCYHSIPFHLNMFPYFFYINILICFNIPFDFLIFLKKETQKTLCF